MLDVGAFTGEFSAEVLRSQPDGRHYTSFDIHTHAPANTSYTNFLLYPFVPSKCSTSPVGHGHGYGCHNPLHAMGVCVSRRRRVCISRARARVPFVARSCLCRHRGGNMRQRMPRPRPICFQRAVPKLPLTEIACCKSAHAQLKQLRIRFQALRAGLA